MPPSSIISFLEEKKVFMIETSELLDHRNRFFQRGQEAEMTSYYLILPPYLMDAEADALQRIGEWQKKAGRTTKALQGYTEDTPEEVQHGHWLLGNPGHREAAMKC
nr:PREDICTED: uncharacterized protein LOC106704897 [Latimeria chalumnae]|eukprot:XP_014348465.1 PREDICTED: uncharacterized protein LOC106704897 [Latimeria chalumnae]